MSGNVKKYRQDKLVFDNGTYKRVLNLLESVGDSGIRNIAQNYGNQVGVNNILELAIVLISRH